MVDAEKNEVEPFTDPAALRLLHYESFSGEDFVRKWTSILAAGPDAELPAGPRAHRGRAADADRQGARPPRQAEPYLMRIFERTTEDDFDTLRDLGLLEHVDPRAGTHIPTAAARRLARPTCSPPYVASPSAPSTTAPLAAQVRKILAGSPPTG